MRENYSSMCENEICEILKKQFENGINVVIINGSARIDVAKAVLNEISMKKQVAVYEHEPTIEIRDIYMTRNVVLVKENNVTAPDSDRVDLLININSSYVASVLSNSKAPAIVVTENIDYKLIKAAGNRSDDGGVIVLQTYEINDEPRIGVVGSITKNDDGILIATL